MDAILAALELHGPIAAVAIGLVYIGRQHIKEDASHHHQVEERLRILETDRVVKADLERVYDRVERLSTELHSGQEKILALLAHRRDE